MTSEAQRRYRWLAPVYDRLEGARQQERTRAIALLDPRPGETVLDLGCGTGLSFELVEDRIGPQGKLIGFDISAEMLEQARQKVEAHGWENVTLVQGDADELAVEEPLDAVLCFYIHDILTSGSAMERVVGLLKAGGRIVAAGWKLPYTRVGRLINAPYLLAGSFFITKYRHLARPWAELERLLPSTHLVEVGHVGLVYLVKAVKE